MGKLKSKNWGRADSNRQRPKSRDLQSFTADNLRQTMQHTDLIINNLDSIFLSQRVPRKEGLKWAGQAQNSMLEDGHDRAEIEDMKTEAMEKAEHQIELRMMRKYEQ
ncbi:hypothetical protein COB11_06525 [Candidatus Aerophobetes bacterium]|uniref:Uncharacterized protein n=1 Tax=Aerophobetes bacterium TaxID=2030807 RepID=A0A2A4YDA3_UNCAE|nr:MAG: hypothetical protein COB11_06525 [Candidatus Aerophobetes bacterium]